MPRNNVIRLPFTIPTIFVAQVSQIRSLSIGVNPFLQCQLSAPGLPSLSFSRPQEQGTLIAFVPFSSLLNRESARTFDKFSLLPSDDEFADAVTAISGSWPNDGSISFEAFEKLALLALFLSEEICKGSWLGQWVSLTFMSATANMSPEVHSALQRWREAMLASAPKLRLFPPSSSLTLALTYVSMCAVTMSMRETTMEPTPSTLPILDLLSCAGRVDGAEQNVAMEICTAKTLRHILALRHMESQKIQFLETILDRDERDRDTPSTHKMEDKSTPAHLRRKAKPLIVTQKKMGSPTSTAEIHFPTKGGKQLLRHAPSADLYVTFFTTDPVANDVPLALTSEYT